MKFSFNFQIFSIKKRRDWFICVVDKAAYLHTNYVRICSPQLWTLVLAHVFWQKKQSFVRICSNDKTTMWAANVKMNFLNKQIITSIIFCILFGFHVRIINLHLLWHSVLGFIPSIHITEMPSQSHLWKEDQLKNGFSIKITNRYKIIVLIRFPIPFSWVWTNNNNQ